MNICTHYTGIYRANTRKTDSVDWTQRIFICRSKNKLHHDFCVCFHSPFCLCSIDFQKLPLDKRVSQALNGDLYFSNVLPEDSRPDYICYARFPHTQTIQQKQPISVTVLDSKTGCGTQLQSRPRILYVLVDTSFMLFSDFQFFPPDLRISLVHLS